MTKLVIEEFIGGFLLLSEGYCSTIMMGAWQRISRHRIGTVAESLYPDV